MPRFEVAGAYVLGALLPILEILRRRTNFSNFESYIDDFIAGGLLLSAAISVSRRRTYGGRLLAGAWGVVCGGFYSSFFAQIRATASSDVSGLPNSAVVVIKGAIFAVGIAAFVRSVMSERNAYAAD